MKRFLAICAACVLAMPVAAQATLYECDITKKSSNINWVSDKYVFIFQKDGVVQVVDNMTLLAVQGPYPVKVRKRQNGTLRMTWRITGLESENASEKFPPFKLTADFNREEKTVRVYNKLAGYGAKITGRGTCQVRKNTKLRLKKP